MMNEERDHPADDPIWRDVPRSKRYNIDGRRYVEVDGKIMSLSQYLDMKDKQAEN
jgi:hypothetical protein